MHVKPASPEMVASAWTTRSRILSSLALETQTAVSALWWCRRRGQRQGLHREDCGELCVRPVRAQLGNRRPRSGPPASCKSASNPRMIDWS